jgi:HemY protein
MIRLVIRFALIVALAGLFAWLADRPGVLRIDWLEHRIEAPLMMAVALVFGVFILSLWLFSLARRSFRAPSSVAEIIRIRKNRNAYQALSRGMIAIGAGDLEAARRNSQIAARVLRNEPLARLLEAQTAQLAGDSKRVTALFEAMTKTNETKLLGLRGLFNQARQSGDTARAGKLAAEALKANPGLAWASKAMLMIQSSERNWQGAADTIEVQRKSRLIDEKTAIRQRAVVLSAQAVEKEKSAPAEALQLALRAQKLDAALVPAALVAARIYAARGQARKAARVIERSFPLHPHVELVRLYSFQKAGASPRERLRKAEDLVTRFGGGEEGAVGVAEAAIAALDWPRAKAALQPFLSDRPKARVCALMAEIAEREGDKGLAREWLARGMRAPADPKWTADGIVSEQWQPASPVTGQLGAFQWRVPVERLAYEGMESAQDVSGATSSEVGTPQIESSSGHAPPEEQQPHSAGAAENSKAAEEDPAKGSPAVQRSSDKSINLPVPDDPGPERDEDALGPGGWASRAARGS